MSVFWVVAPCSLVEVYQRFRDPCCLIVLMMEAARTSETLVNFYQNTRRCNSEDSHLRTHCRENLKSYSIYYCFNISLCYGRVNGSFLSRSICTYEPYSISYECLRLLNVVIFNGVSTTMNLIPLVMNASAFWMLSFFTEYLHLWTLFH
jgi:hypothetical protein